VKVKRKANDAEPLAQHTALEGFRGGQAREGARVVSYGRQDWRQSGRRGAKERDQQDCQPGPPGTPGLPARRATKECKRQTRKRTRTETTRTHTIRTYQHDTRPFAACAKHFLTCRFPSPALLSLSLIPCLCLGVLAPGPAYAICLCVQGGVGACWLLVAGGGAPAVLDT
jgi:hypothetical protein